MAKIKKQTAKWKTKDGKVIRICDMDDNHLVNTLKLFKKQAQKIYKKEHEKESYNDEWREYVFYNFYPIELEAKRRELFNWEKEFVIQNYTQETNKKGLILDDWNGIRKKIRVTNKFKLIRFN